MPLYFAFLRGINVGGHRIKMPELQRLFESLGFTDVESVIQSGNIIFQSPDSDIPALEHTIEQHLEKALGYQVATFLRTAQELALIARHQPFGPVDHPADAVIYAILLRDKPKASVKEALKKLNTQNDEVSVRNREVYWLRRVRCKEAEIFGVQVGKILGPEATTRNMTTLKKIADKYS